jgi:hypothetical protein
MLLALLRLYFRRLRGFLQVQERRIVHVQDLLAKPLFCDVSLQLHCRGQNAVFNCERLQEESHLLWTLQRVEFVCVCKSNHIGVNKINELLVDHELIWRAAELLGVLFGFVWVDNGKANDMVSEGITINKGLEDIFRLNINVLELFRCNVFTLG